MAKPKWACIQSLAKYDSSIGLQKYTNALLVSFRTINVSNAISYGIFRLAIACKADKSLMPWL
jgi:hypothetical protein